MDFCEYNRKYAEVLLREAFSTITKIDDYDVIDQVRLQQVFSLLAFTWLIEHAHLKMVLTSETEIKFFSGRVMEDSPRIYNKPITYHYRTTKLAIFSWVL